MLSVANVKIHGVIRETNKPVVCHDENWSETENSAG